MNNQTEMLLKQWLVLKGTHWAWILTFMGKNSIKVYRYALVIVERKACRPKNRENMMNQSSWEQMLT